MRHKRPPFNITPSILDKGQKIAFTLGLLAGAKLDSFSINLRKESQVRTIHSSLAIEGNRLTIEQVTGILEGKKVIGPKQDILEVNNAIQVYSNLEKWDPLSVNSLKKAHKMLMDGLVFDNGQWRTKGVGIFKGNDVAHVAPPANRVPALINELFTFIKEESQIPWLIKACIFHYELEFIHPFSDGNGRIGRLWQQILLMRENSAFQYISIESVIKNNQERYYTVLSECDKCGDSTLFLEFSLEQILVALNDLIDKHLNNRKMDVDMRLQYAKPKLRDVSFSRKDYLKIHTTISTATASRDLEYGIVSGILKKSGKNKLTEYQYR